jgi:hypothetical protein
LLATFVYRGLALGPVPHHVELVTLVDGSADGTGWARLSTRAFGCIAFEAHVLRDP